MNRESEEALRAVAMQFGATCEDLERIGRRLGASAVPTLASFAPEARRLLSGRTADTYGHHIDRLVAEFGDRRLDQITPLELERLALEARNTALSRRDARHGFGAQESFVNATRFVFACALRSGHLGQNPAASLRRPRRRRSIRRALSAEELSALFQAVVATSRDPDLDLLVLAFARETACRREGILNLRRRDLQTTPSVILYEKFEEQREIPVSRALANALASHHQARVNDDEETLFRYRSGRPLTDRHFDTIFKRAGTHLPWVRALGVSLHWIRYSTLTDVRMISGERVAAAYAGHGDASGGVTGLYTRATFAELQAAHARLFGHGASG